MLGLWLAIAEWASASSSIANQKSKIKNLKPEELSMEPERPDGDGGSEKGLKVRGGGGLIEKARGQAVALRERAEAEAKAYKDPQQTQLWKSIFRVSHDRS